MSNEIDVYTQYYLRQAGSGFSNIYSGPTYQKGLGIGSYLGGLFRACFPIFKKGSVALGEELLKSGIGVAKDIIQTGDLEASQKKRGREFINNISTRVSDHMFGSGYMPAIAANLKQSKRRVVRRKTQGRVTKKKGTKRKKKTATKKRQVKKNKKKRVNRSKLDIFS